MVLGRRGEVARQAAEHAEKERTLQVIVWNCEALERNYKELAAIAAERGRGPATTKDAEEARAWAMKAARYSEEAAWHARMKGELLRR